MNQKDKPYTHPKDRAKDNRMMPSNPCLDSKANGTANHQKSPNSHEGKQNKPS
jgi:hypothetical protein